MGAPNISIYKSGYIIQVNYDGTFLDGTFAWPASGCSGTPVWWDGNGGGTASYYQTVLWSAAANKFYVTSGTGSGSNHVYTSTSYGGTYSYESTNFDYGFGPGSYNCSTASYQGDPSGYAGWPLTQFNPASTLGWNLTTCSISAQLNANTPGSQTDSCLAGPLQLP